MAEITNATEVKAKKAKKAKAPKDPHVLTEKQMKVLETVRSMSGDFTVDDIAEKAGMSKSAVNILVTGLATKHLMHRTDYVTVEAGEGKTARVKFVVLDEEGLSDAYHC